MFIEYAHYAHRANDNLRSMCTCPAGHVCNYTQGCVRVCLWILQKPHICDMRTNQFYIILQFRCVNYFPPTVSVRVSVTVRVSLVFVITANKLN